MPKPSFFYQSDRPESGGADRDGERENNRLLELEKERLAVEKSQEDREPGAGRREPADDQGSEIP